MPDPIIISPNKKRILESADGCKIIIDKILKISNPLPTDVSRLTDLIRGTLPVVRSKRKLKKEIFKEGSTLNKKGSKVTSSSLNYSESYNNPADKYK